MALLVWGCLSNAASCVLCVARRLKDHNDLQHHSPRLKNTCIRQSSARQVVPQQKAKPTRAARSEAEPQRSAAKAAAAWLTYNNNNNDIWIMNLYVFI